MGGEAVERPVPVARSLPGQLLSRDEPQAATREIVDACHSRIIRDSPLAVPVPVPQVPETRLDLSAEQDVLQQVFFLKRPQVQRK